MNYLNRPAYKLKVPDKIAELIRSMHPYLKKKVRFSLQQILNNPSSGKELKDELSGLFSFRVGSFRIIYKIPGDKIIEIVSVGPRKSIYEETFKIIQREKNKGSK